MSFLPHREDFLCLDCHWIGSGNVGSGTLSGQDRTWTLQFRHSCPQDWHFGRHGFQSCSCHCRMGHKLVGYRMVLGYRQVLGCMRAGYMQEGCKMVGDCKIVVGCKIVVEGCKTVEGCSCWMGHCIHLKAHYIQMEACSCCQAAVVGIEGDTAEGTGEVGSMEEELHNLLDKDMVVEDRLGEEDMLVEGSRVFDGVHHLDHQSLQGHHPHQ